MHFLGALTVISVKCTISRRPWVLDLPFGMEKHGGATVYLRVFYILREVGGGWGSSALFF